MTVINAIAAVQSTDQLPTVQNWRWEIWRVFQSQTRNKCWNNPLPKCPILVTFSDDDSAQILSKKVKSATSKQLALVFSEHEYRHIAEYKQFIDNDL